MIKTWIIAISMTALLSIGGCNEEQIAQMDRFVADANSVVDTGGIVLQSPAGKLLPPGLQLYGAAGIAIASVMLNGWQNVRNNLMKKTTKAIVKGVEAAGKEIKTNPSNPIKTAIAAEMRAAGIYDRANLLVDQLKIAR